MAFDFITMFILGEWNVNELICLYVINGFTYFHPFIFHVHSKVEVEKHVFGGYKDAVALSLSML